MGGGSSKTVAYQVENIRVNTFIIPVLRVAPRRSLQQRVVVRRMNRHELQTDLNKIIEIPYKSPINLTNQNAQILLKSTQMVTDDNFHFGTPTCFRTHELPQTHCYR